MYKSFLENLDLESNNVDQVYNENLKKWKSNNINFSDKDFVIQEIEHLSNINLETISELDLAKRRIYSIYLSKIKSQFPWDLEDYYNRYKDTKEFYMIKLNLNRSISYEDFKNTLKEYKAQYYYILDKLPEEEKLEFKCDFSDQLKAISKKKEATKYKELIKEVRQEINSTYKQYIEKTVFDKGKEDNQTDSSKKLNDKYLGESSNKKADALFNYLCNNYKKNDNTQVKYINILYYLKNDTNKKEYIFELKQKDYKTLIEKEQGVKISKFAKSETYIDVQKQILNKLEESFRAEYADQ